MTRLACWLRSIAWVAAFAAASGLGGCSQEMPPVAHRPDGGVAAVDGAPHASDGGLVDAPVIAPDAGAPGDGGPQDGGPQDGGRLDGGPNDGAIAD